MRVGEGMRVKFVLPKTGNAALDALEVSAELSVIEQHRDVLEHKAHAINAVRRLAAAQIDAIVEGALRAVAFIADPDAQPDSAEESYHAFFNRLHEGLPRWRNTNRNALLLACVERGRDAVQNGLTVPTATSRVEPPRRTDPPRRRPRARRRSRRRAPRPRVRRRAPGRLV